jgi:MFS family permease
MTSDSELRIRPSLRPAAIVCALAMLSLATAMGIGRFAFTPMLPLMARDGLLTADAGAWLAGANYLGYLLGALSAGRIGVSPPVLSRASLAGIAILTAAMGTSDVLPIWLALRFVAGVLSAWALVSTSAWALGQLAAAGRPDLAGFVYAGVGIGIALVGVFCLYAARPGVASGSLWLELGVLAAFAAAIPVRLREPPPPASIIATRTQTGIRASTRNAGIVICYGLFGFGYILPATFLPALARELVDDPHLFGLAWPVFGVAAALSTVATARYLQHMNRLRVWAYASLVMAVGVVLPSFWLSPISIAIVALSVGSTFMVMTMAGLQEARARSPRNPSALLGGMTAAFATGQLAGPLASAILAMLPAGHAAGLDISLQIAAFALAASAAYLFCIARDKPTEGIST